MTVDTTGPAPVGTPAPDRTTAGRGGAPGGPDPAPSGCARRASAACGPCRGCRRRRLAGVLAADDGAATAEYAVVILAAVGFAGLLVTLLRSDEVRGVLTDLVRRALTVG